MAKWGRWERAAGVAIVALGLLSGLGLGAAAGDAAAQGAPDEFGTVTTWP